MINQKTNCFISTGYKQVMHTLWMEVIVPPNSEKKFHGFVSYNYIKNLSMDQMAAENEAKEFAKSKGIEYLGIKESPIHKRAKHIEMYNMTFKHKRKHGKSFYFGEASPEFWDAWKKNKDVMKQQGFRVSKYTKQRSRDTIVIWYVFYQPLEMK